MALQIMTREGGLVTTIPVKQGRPLALSPDSKSVLLLTPIGLEGVDLQGQASFEIPFSRYDSATVLVANDYSGVLVLQGRSNARVQWFNLK